MFLETKRLNIRPFVIDDTTDAHALFSLIEVMQPVGMAPALDSVSQSKERLSRWIKHRLHHAIVHRDEEKVIGYVIVKLDSEKERTNTCELGFALHPGYQRKGYMTETVEAVLEYLQKSDIQYVWACCFDDNLASKAFIERRGFIFQREGKYWAEAEGKMYPSLEYRMDLKKACSP